MIINRCYQAPFNDFHRNSETRKAIDHYSYALNEEIGRGFSSKVYRGRDENTQTAVAVKVIDMKMVKQSIHAVLLKNEIAALKAFNSKNILKLFDVFQTQNNTYIITELCESGDLSGLLKKRGRIEEQEAVRLMIDIVSGLYEMNFKGYIHRDIKPANILLDNGGVPKLADFGFAIQVNSQDARQQGRNYNVGTPLYMSPQALRQQGHTEKGDVWAMGVMYFELLFGHPPFSAHSEQALLSTILHTQLVIPSYPPVSDISKDFIRRCLMVDENQRFRVRDLASHSLIQRQQNMKPLTQVKDNRSLSQGAREFHTRPKCQTQVILNEPKQKQEIYQLAPPPKVCVQPLQEIQNNSMTALTHKNSFEEVEKPPSRSTRRPNTQINLIEENKPVNVQSVQSPMKFKTNNDLLFSQINFCRFLFKFSQQLMNQKTLNLSNGLREKLLFLLAKNIAMKINKLGVLNDQENRKENPFGLDDLENYKKSESFQKFSQAIQEYSDKYSKHFSKMFTVIEKQNLTQDKKFEALFDKDLNEFESFYFITQSYIRQALQELKTDLDADDTYKTFITSQLCNYLHLCHLVLANMNDYRKFHKSVALDVIVDAKQTKMSAADINSLRTRIQELVNK